MTSFTWWKLDIAQHDGSQEHGPTDRAEMEAGVIARTAELMRLGRRMLELGAAVTVASLRPS